MTTHPAIEKLAMQIAGADNWKGADPHWVQWWTEAAKRAAVAILSEPPSEAMLRDMLTAYIKDARAGNEWSDAIGRAVIQTANRARLRELGLEP